MTSFVHFSAFAFFVALLSLASPSSARKIHLASNNLTAKEERVRDRIANATPHHGERQLLRSPFSSSIFEPRGFHRLPNNNWPSSNSDPLSKYRPPGIFGPLGGLQRQDYGSPKTLGSSYGTQGSYGSPSPYGTQGNLGQGFPVSPFSGFNPGGSALSDPFGSVRYPSLTPSTSVPWQYLGGAYNFDPTASQGGVDQSGPINLNLGMVDAPGYNTRNPTLDVPYVPSKVPPLPPLWASRAFMSPGTYYPPFKGDPFSPPDFFGPSNPQVDHPITPTQQIGYPVSPITQQPGSTVLQQPGYSIPQQPRYPTGYITPQQPGYFNNPVPQQPGYFNNPVLQPSGYPTPQQPGYPILQQPGYPTPQQPVYPTPQQLGLQKFFPGLRQPVSSFPGITLGTQNRKFHR